MVNLSKRTSNSFLREGETTAHLLLRVTHGPPPGTSLLGKPDGLVDALRSNVGINLSRTAHLSGKFQEAINWAFSGQDVAAELAAAFAALVRRRAILVNHLHVRLREAVSPFFVHEFALRGDVACLGTECLWIGGYQRQMEPIVSRGRERGGGRGREEGDSRKGWDAIEKAFRRAATKLPMNRNERTYVFLGLTEGTPHIPDGYE